MNETPSLPVTPRTQIKRLPKRGDYDRQTIYTILDAGLVCHVGFAIEGQPFVIPTAYGRAEDQIYIHGSPLSRMMRNLQQGVDLCLTVTLLDGLVLARSAFHHSMNYRSVVVFGIAQRVTNPDEKCQALRSFSEHMMPGRWADVRPPTPSELSGTIVLALSLSEASAKIRQGPPLDDEVDYALPVWAGEVPLHLVAGPPIPDPKLHAGLVVPPYVAHIGRSPSLNQTW